MISDFKSCRKERWGCLAIKAVCNEKEKHMKGIDLDSGCRCVVYESRLTTASHEKQNAKRLPV